MKICEKEKNGDTLCNKMSINYNNIYFITMNYNINFLKSMFSHIIQNFIYIYIILISIEWKFIKMEIFFVMTMSINISIHFT